MSAAIRFDSERHLYFVAERRVPGITEILREAGLLDDEEWMSAAGRERGSRVHKAIMFDAEGALDDASMDPGELGYVNAARACLKELKAEDVRAETLVCNGVYATHVDILARTRLGDTLIDWKTGGKREWHRLQTAGAADLLEMKSVKRVVVYLGADGKYTTDESRDWSDFTAFRSMLSAWAWKASNGLLRGDR